MNLDQLQAELAERGCVLWVEGEMLRFRAPDGALTPPLMAQLKRNKRELISRLGSAAQPAKRAVHSQEPSFGQQAMWLLHQSAPDSPAYNVASAVEIRSPISADILRRVWQTLIARHDSLRTTFETCAGRLVARVNEQPPVDLEIVDAAGDDDRQLSERVRMAYQRPFDLTEGPLARLRLFSVCPERHVLLMSMHHIILDAWSLWVLHDEFGSLYRQEARGEVGVLPILDANYGDFVRWQQEMPNTEAGRAQWDRWKQRLADDPEPARLPWDHDRPKRREQRGATLQFRLPTELANAVRELGKKSGATPFMTLLAIFQTLIYRLSGQNDFVIGTTSSGRAKKEFNRLVGYLVNTLPLRASIKPGMRFTDLLEATRETTIEAISGQEFPFPLMVERLNPRREAGALPLCRVMFGLQKPHDFSEAMLALDDAHGSIDWGGLRASAFSLDQQEGQFDLTLEMYETTSTFLGVLKYDTAMLDRETAELIAGRYEHLARELVSDPTQLLDKASIISPAEQSVLDALADCNEPGELGVERLDVVFERQAAATPDAIAIEIDDALWTYRGVNERSNQIAAWLRERGVSPGDRVACCLQRGADAWLAQLACFKAGATYLPIDDAWPTKRVIDLLANSGAALLLADVPTAERLDFASAELGTRLELLDESADEIDQQASDNTQQDLAADDPAYVIYTSGSTGKPKGVVVSHAAFAHHLARIQLAYGITAEDRVLQFSAMTFDPSLEQAWSAWSAGATLILRGQELWSTTEFCERIQRHRVTVANLPPAYFQEASDARNRGDACGGTLRLMVVGGEAFPTEAIKAWRGSGTQILNAYGPTEAVVTATLADMTSFDPAAGLAPIGRPLPGTSAFVVDKNLRLAPRGVVGELCLSGPALADGYLGEQANTAKRFGPLPSVTGDNRRVYRTGDLVRWTNRGDLEFLGRVDRQVKVHGYRIELGEVERALESVSGVTQAVVRVQESGREKTLVAYFTTEEDITPAELSAAARGRLPHYMMPVATARVDEFPRKASGKIDDAALAPIDLARAAPPREYTAPENDAQRVLTEVWSDVLGVERVGIHDDFFELGGASLKSLQIVSAAEAKGVRLAEAALTPALLFEYPTIAQLAELVVFSDATNEAGVAAAN